MFSWLTFVGGLVKLLSGFVEYLGQRQLINLGHAGAVRESLEGVLYNVEQAQRAERGLYVDREWAQRVRDKYERDPGRLL